LDLNCSVTTESLVPQGVDGRKAYYDCNPSFGVPWNANLKDAGIEFLLYLSHALWGGTKTMERDKIKRTSVVELS